ncbi:MAG: transglutaminase domain-containing protein [Methanotrichaceae archaeon]|nr:transglutaminase domain-containing protein [Methanotrichaceae archaeon]
MAPLHRSTLPFVLLLLLTCGSASDVPCVFGADGIQSLDDGPPLLESATGEETALVASGPSQYLPNVPLIAQYDESDQVDVLTGAAPVAGGAGSGNSRQLGEIKQEINQKVDVENEDTRNAAVIIAAQFPGVYNIDQISSIYSYLKDGWSYVNDPRGLDYYSSASNTLKLGKELDCVGAGDCDDFAILMSALIEAIGGSTRIIFAYGNNAGHAYTEVYLGSLNDPDSHVREKINWLKSKYDSDQIFTHVDPASQEVWLNLDWSADHPGGPFYNANRHVVLMIREEYTTAAPGLPRGFEALSSGQSYGVIRGQVLSSGGLPMVATVILTDERGREQMAVTDDRGSYRVELPAGSYRITAERTGYEFQQISTDLSTGQEREVPISGSQEYVIETGFTLGDVFGWGDDGLSAQGAA